MSVDEEVEQAKERKAFTGLLFFLLIMLLAIVAAVAMAKWRSAGVLYLVDFKDARDLPKGAKVRLSGFPIGEVVRVQLTGEDEVLVTARIDDEYAEKVKQDSRAIIASPSLKDVSGRKVLDVYNGGDENSPPIKEETRVTGLENIVELKAWQLKQQFRDISKNASEAGRSFAQKMELVLDELKDIPESPEVKAALEKIAEIAALMKEKGGEEFEELGARWNELRETIAPTLEEWKIRGKEKALDAWQSLREYAEKKLQEYQEYKDNKEAASSMPAQSAPAR
jgi:hypothetical protein